MIYLVDDFYNKALEEIYKTYFPLASYYMDCKNTRIIRSNMEWFNNGLLTYNKLVNIISKQCCDSEHNIHLILGKFIKNEIPLKDFDGTFIEYSRKPTEFEIKRGYGARHYKRFPKSVYMGKKGVIKNRLLCPIDNLIYTR